MTTVVRTNQRSRRGVNKAYVDALVEAGGLGTLREVDGDLVLQSPASLLPETHRGQDIGAPDRRFAHIYGQEVITGDLVLRRRGDDGELIQWRLIEHPTRIEAQNELTGESFDLVFAGQGGPWWKRALRSLLLFLLR